MLLELTIESEKNAANASDIHPNFSLEGKRVSSTKSTFSEYVPGKAGESAWARDVLV